MNTAVISGCLLVTVAVGADLDVRIVTQNRAARDVWQFGASSTSVGTVTSDVAGTMQSQVAQSFRLPYRTRVTAIDFHIYAGDNCTTGLTLRIENDDRGEPAGTLATSGAVATIDPVPGQKKFQRFSPAGPVDLPGWKTFWMVISKPFQEGPDAAYAVRTSLKDEVGPRDWYPQGRAAERFVARDPTRSDKVPNQGRWNVLISHDYYFQIHGRPLVSRNTPRPSSARPLLGSYGVKIREDPDNRLNPQRMVEGLVAMRATDFFYLVIDRRDWDDLQTFLPIARQAGISVWPYLLPPSETSFGDPHGRLPQPYGLDYHRWAEHIARLSLQHPNLKGFAVDDFAQNEFLFTPRYVQRMMLIANSINPKLAFYPLLYYQYITPQFAESYHHVVDGVIGAYPTDLETIRRARAVLRDGNTDQPRFDIPLIVMTPAAPYMYKDIRGEPATPQRIEEETRFGLQAVLDGHADGIVPYRGSLHPGDPYLQAVADALADWDQARKGVADE